MNNNEINELQEKTLKTIRDLNQAGFAIMDSYYTKVELHRKNLDDKSKIGNTGIVTRKGVDSDEVYFYWCKFSKNRSLKYSREGGSTTFQTLYKKGGVTKFEYSMKAFKNEPLDWEMELIKEFEPQLAKIREALKSSRDALRLEKKAFGLAKKVLCKTEE